MAGDGIAEIETHPFRMQKIEENMYAGARHGRRIGLFA
jgi:hypothetical protein